MIHSVKSVLAEMKKTADPGRLDGMARYGINIERRLGLKMPEMGDRLVEQRQLFSQPRPGQKFHLSCRCANFQLITDFFKVG